MEEMQHITGSDRYREGLPGGTGGQTVEIWRKSNIEKESELGDTPAAAAHYRHRHTPSDPPPRPAQRCWSRPAPARFLIHTAAGCVTCTVGEAGMVLIMFRQRPAREREREREGERETEREREGERE